MTLRCRGRVVRVLAAVTVVGGIAAAGAAPAAAATRTDVLDSAARYGARHGYHVGIAVLDTRTDALYTSGHADDSYISASVVKVLVATRLLLAGRMHGQVQLLAYKMITQSDNDATDQLYPLAGGGSLEPWLARHYHVPDLGAPSANPAWWGYTHLVPRGLVRLYARLKQDPAVGPWLLRAMRHIRRTSSAGEYQWWGLPSATTGAAVKQGWNIAYGHANVNTTGFVNGDRYAVAILTRGPVSSYLARISNAVTHMARLLLPGGRFPDDIPKLTALSRHSAPTRDGWDVVVHGSDFTGVTRVVFGTVDGRNVRVSSPSTLTVTAPPHGAGWVDIRVVTSHGTSARTGADRFRFVAPPTIIQLQPATGPTAGGSQVTIKGTNFVDVRQVTFAGVGAAVRTLGETALQVSAPAHPAGYVDVVVVTAYGTSSAARYLYDDGQPQVNNAQPSAANGATRKPPERPSTERSGRAKPVRTAQR